MGLLQRLVKSVTGEKKEFKEKFKEAEMQMKIEKTLQERQKSANERELERYVHEQREANIKKQLDSIHKQQNKEMWKTKNTILAEKTTILKDDRPILMEKNIFLDNKTKIPVSGGRMFFKW